MQGRALGGSSTINGMLWTRGNSRDYDHWAALGNTGWDYASVLPYFKNAEDYQGPVDELSGTMAGLVQSLKNPGDLMTSQADGGWPIMGCTI